MIQINVLGYAGEGKSEIIQIIESALRSHGKRALVVTDTPSDLSPQPCKIDCVITEQTTHKSPTDTNFDFLVGQTEAAAYEMVQDQGYVVRIKQRNLIPMPTNANNDYNEGRVNLSIVNNIVVNWSIG